MKVIDAYIEEFYVHFVLDNNVIKSYPTYWAFSPWNYGASEHEEFQSLLKQATEEKEYECLECHSKNKCRIPIRNYVCGLCQIDQEIIADILRAQQWEKECK